MLKLDEINIATSCWNKALPNERVFIGLTRDPAVPHMIREWVRKRLEMGLNVDSDAQIQEALDCATLMEADRDEINAQRCGDSRRTER